MNNFTISSTQPRKPNKSNRIKGLASTDVSHFNKGPKFSDQILDNEIKTEISQTSLPSEHSVPLENSKRFELENYFDSILENMTVLPLHTAIEPILTSIYTSYKSIIWISKDFKSYSFYSPTLDLHVSGEETLHAVASRAKTSIISPPNLNAFTEDQASDNDNNEFKQIEAECSKLFFPLYLKSGNVITVAEILRTESQNPFDDLDLKIASFLIKKFLLYGSAVFKPSETVFLASEFSHITSPNNVYKNLSKALIDGFGCKIVDFWCHHNNLTDILRLDSETGEFIQPPRSNIGVVTAAIRNKSNLNSKSPRYHPNFSFNGDPLPDEAILISTYEIDDCIFAAVLRGKKDKNVFSAEEESKLEAVMPFISRSLLFSINVAKKNVQKKDPYEIQLADLLDCAAHFATQLTLDNLINAIQEKSAKLVKAKSCCFILYDYLTNQFIFDHENVKLSGNLGLAGNVASFGSPIRVSSPMSDSRFDKKVDFDVHGKEEIQSMLIVPVYSVLENVIGVISLANKIKKPEFTEEDERIILTIAIFASISLQNSKIYQTSISLTQKLNSFVRIKKDKNDFLKNNEKSVLIKILKKARDESKAYRVTLFLSKEDKTQGEQSLLLYRSIGGPPEQGTRFSMPSVQQKKTISYPINDDLSERSIAPLSSRVARCSLNHTGISNSLQHPTPSTTPNLSKPSTTSSNKVDTGTSPSPSQSGKLICCTPIFILNKDNDTNEIVGVLEICVNSIGTVEEIDLVQNFCNIVVLSIRQNAADEILSIRNEQFALFEAIPDSEFDLFTVPSRFKENVPENLFTREFDITTIDSKFLFNLVFSVFNKFGLMHEFEIKASKLFLFMYRVKNLYKDEEKWRHSIEVTCFLSFLLLLTKFDEKILKNELLSLIIASLCHDIDCPSISNELPSSTSRDVALDVLYSKRSAFESQSCFEAISLMSSPESNLIENLSDDQAYFCNELIIQFILSTDYYKHYQLLHDFKDMVSNNNVNFNDLKSRLLIMEILLKCSDAGVIGRNNIIADKYQETVCDEFFLHGPFEKAREIMFTSVLKDRSHIDKKKSQKSVLESVFAPMFRLVIKVFPQMTEICNCALENISRWTGIPLSASALPSSAAAPAPALITNEEDKDKLGPDRMLENE